MRNLSAIVVGFSIALAGMNSPAFAQWRNCYGWADEQTLREFADENNFSVKQVLIFQAITDELAIPFSNMRAGLRSFAHQMPDLRNNQGALSAFLLQHGAGTLRNDLADAAKILDYDAALLIIMQANDNLSARDPKLAGMLSDEVFGDEIFGRVTIARYRDIVKRFGEALDEDNFNRFCLSLSGIKQKEL